MLFVPFFQINSIVDIGTSFYSQFSALVYEFVDNTGFEALPELEHGDGMKNLEAVSQLSLERGIANGFYWTTYGRFWPC